MEKQFTSKRIVKTDGGEDLIEVTKNIKVKYQPKQVLSQIEKIEANIVNLNSKKEELQKIYEEITE